MSGPHELNRLPIFFSLSVCYVRSGSQLHCPSGYDAEVVFFSFSWLWILESFNSTDFSIPR